MDLLAEYRRAERFLESGEPLEAARLLAPIVAAEPDNAAVRHLLARAYFHSAQLGPAERELRALVDRDPADHYAHHVLGRTLERGGRLTEALTHLRLAAAMRSIDEYVEAVQRVSTRLQATPKRRPGLP